MWLAGGGLALTALSMSIRWLDPCTTANRGLPFAIYSNWCECLGEPGPHWYPLHALVDWGILSGVCLGLLVLYRLLKLAFR